MLASAVRNGAARASQLGWSYQMVRHHCSCGVWCSLCTCETSWRLPPAWSGTSCSDLGRYLVVKHISMHQVMPAWQSFQCCSPLHLSTTSVNVIHKTKLNDYCWCNLTICIVKAFNSFQRTGKWCRASSTSGSLTGRMDWCCHNVPCLVNAENVAALSWCLGLMSRGV